MKKRNSIDKTNIPSYLKNLALTEEKNGNGEKKPIRE